MSRDNMIMEGVFHEQRFIRPTVQSTEICVVFREKQLRLYGVCFRINFKVIVGTDGRR